MLAVLLVLLVLTNAPRPAHGTRARQRVVRFWGLPAQLVMACTPKADKERAGRASAEIENFVSDLPTDGALGLT
jgi:hypothetical protein